jgi:hypothetical protein
MGEIPKVRRSSTPTLVVQHRVLAPIDDTAVDFRDLHYWSNIAIKPNTVADSVTIINSVRTLNRHGRLNISI